MSLELDPAVKADLERRYAEPHRAYHTMDHVRHCLAEFAEARPLASDPDAVEAAIWFHDAVYRPGRPGNEEESAKLLRAAGYPEKAAAMVRASTHRRIPEDPDTRLFLDIDLAILGQSPERFARYEEEVRREHRHVPGLLYRFLRRRILDRLRRRPTLYLTPFFRKRYEAAARANLRRR